MNSLLVLCLGNELRSDDGVGPAVAAALATDPPAGAVVRTSNRSGLHLLDDMEGFSRVILVDAVQTGRREPGSVVDFALETLPPTAGTSAHGLGLPTALRLARAFGAPVPEHIHVVAIEVADQATMERGLCARVALAVPVAAAAVRGIVAASSLGV